MTRMVEGTELAALTFYLAQAARLGHTPSEMLAQIAQDPAAVLGSAADDCWVWALEHGEDNAA